MKSRQYVLTRILMLLHINCLKMIALTTNIDKSLHHKITFYTKYIKI